MLTYLVKRLVMTAVVLLVVLIALAVMIRLVPGDPVRAILGPQASDSMVAGVRSEMGLDKPVRVQVADFIGNALRGDLGQDFLSHTPVTSLIGGALPNTILLALAGLGLAVLFGIPLGLYAAVHEGRILDRILGLLSISLVTLPSYVAGLILLLVFALAIPILPAVGAGDPSDPLDYLRHLALPAVALALTWVGYIARLVRTSLVEVLASNYIRTGHAFGLRRSVVFYKYALKNALVPTVAVLGVGLGHLMGGAVFVEMIFSRPGLGTLILSAISSRNYPVVRGGVLTIAVLFVVANLLADLSYRLLDPRIRIEEGMT
jgi:peptide/nickel transport system permease protein